MAITNTTRKQKFVLEFVRQQKDLSFEDNLLEVMCRQNIVEYAENFLDMVEDYDAEEQGIEDYSDDEIRIAAKNRGLIPSANIVNEDFIDRFSSIIQNWNPIEVEDFLQQKEKELNI